MMRCQPGLFCGFSSSSSASLSTIELMKSLNLDNGSIDFVKTNDGKWVYLEINPVGQFGMVSEPCNYNLEREIAQELIK